MKDTPHLTREQRYQIGALKAAGMNGTAIAHNLGVNKSTISREVLETLGYEDTGQSRHKKKQKNATKEKAMQAVSLRRAGRW